MNKLQELMVITMEECGELIQSCSKIIRKFENIEEITGDRRDQLIEEVGDVVCMIELMFKLGCFNEEEINNRVLLKREKLKKWSNLIE